MSSSVQISEPLRRLFPAEHPASVWLLRLMIIRDDLEYELRNLSLKPDDGAEEVWRCVYFLRRIAISISEARGILEQDLGKAINRVKDDAIQALAPVLRNTIEAVVDAAKVVEPIRNAVGAHVRPQNANPKGPDVVHEVLCNQPGHRGTATIDLASIRNTSYRGMSSVALAFAWPTARTDEEIGACHDKLRDAVFAAVPKLLHAVDFLLAYHWMTLGVLVPPEGHDFAMRDPKTGDWVRLVPYPVASRE